MRRGKEVAAVDHEGTAEPPRRRMRVRLTATYRAIAGNIGVSLFTQFGLLVSGVAGARILGVLDRGRSALLLLFATVLPLLGTLGTPLSVTYWIARNQKAGLRIIHKLRRLIVIQLLGLEAIHALILVIVFGNAPTHVQIAAGISLLGTPAISIFFYALAVLQGLKDFRALNLCMLIFPPLNAATLLVLYGVGARGLWMVTIVWVAFYLLSAFATVFAARRSLHRAATDEPVPDEELPMGEMVRFGLKAQLGSMSPLTGFQLDQAIVGLFISQAALGIYVVAVAFTNLPRFVAQSIGLVAYPNVAAEHAEHGSEHHLRSILKFLALTVVLCGAIVVATEVLLPYVLPPLFGHSFASAVGVARILLISSLLFCVTRVLSDCARGANRPGLGTVAEVVSLLMLFPFVAIFSGHGAKGVAGALALAAGCGVLVIVIGLTLPERATRVAAKLRPPRPGRAEAASQPAAQPSEPPSAAVEV